MTCVPRARGCWLVAVDEAAAFEDMLVNGTRSCLGVRGKQRDSERGMVQRREKGADREAGEGRGRSRRAECAIEGDAIGETFRVMLKE